MDPQTLDREAYELGLRDGYTRGDGERIALASENSRLRSENNAPAFRATRGTLRAAPGAGLVIRRLRAHLERIAFAWWSRRMADHKRWRDE